MSRECAVCDFPLVPSADGSGALACPRHPEADQAEATERIDSPDGDEPAVRPDLAEQVGEVREAQQADGDRVMPRGGSD